MRLVITNGTVVYCGRELVKPGSRLEDVKIELEREYGVEAYGVVGSPSKRICDNGNAHGRLPVAVSADYATKAEAFAAAVELAAWCDAHTTGTLELAVCGRDGEGRVLSTAVRYPAGLAGLRTRTAECLEGQRVVYEFDFLLGGAAFCG